MLKDLVIAGAIIGILGDALKLIFNYLSFKAGYAKVVFWQITASRFLDKADLHKPVAYLIGGVADLTVTAVLGVVFLAFIHYIVGRDFLWLKGIGFGMAVWVGLFGTLLGETVQNKLPQEPSGILVTIGAHVVFGAGLSLFTWLYYKVANEDALGQHFIQLSPVPAAKILRPADDRETDHAYRKVKLKKPVKLKPKKID